MRADSELLQTINLLQVKEKPSREAINLLLLPSLDSRVALADMYEPHIYERRLELAKCLRNLGVGALQVERDMD
jgi:hypothetical protein